MILHPGALALIFGSAITMLLLIYAAINGTTLLIHWDYNSSSAYQLSLERRTYLISTLVNYALCFQIASLILFIYTMDDIHRLFVGAMCATGSLNANPVGWYTLASKIIVFFLSGFWVALNGIDQQAEEYPLVKLKYWLLLGLLPFIALDAALQLKYFLGLDPDIITSCCGSLFGGDSEQIQAAITALPVFPAMVAFYGGSVVLTGLIVLNLFWRSGVLRYLLAVATAGFFILSIASIIAFVSIYAYELPTHHCPFDILQREYNFIGYPLYLTLFTGTYFGMLPGLFQSLKTAPCLHDLIGTMEKKWLYRCIVCVVAQGALVTYTVYSSNLSSFL
ncbi:MAG: hypothetical protein GY703_16380 [Gammaproteobacteria bacterium]|nr:hypothetical protein [Gammaproteobacteria bacterium]